MSSRLPNLRPKPALAEDAGLTLNRPDPLLEMGTPGHSARGTWLPGVRGRAGDNLTKLGF